MEIQTGFSMQLKNNKRDLSMLGCEARVIGQEKSCKRCGYMWSINDPEPPTCKTKYELLAEYNRRRIDELRKKWKIK